MRQTDCAFLSSPFSSISKSPTTRIRQASLFRHRHTRTHTVPNPNAVIPPFHGRRTLMLYVVQFGPSVLNILVLVDNKGRLLVWLSSRQELRTAVRLEISGVFSSFPWVGFGLESYKVESPVRSKASIVEGSGRLVTLD